MLERLRVLNTDRSKCEREARELRTNAQADRAEAASQPEQGAELNERADRRDARAQELEVEAARLRCEIDEAERFEAVIRERMLEP